MRANRAMRALRWMDTAIGVLSIPIGLIALVILMILAAQVARGQVATQPATQPADVYRIAGEARRAAGVRVLGHVWCTWINWHPEKYTSPEARELVDGYCLLTAPEGDGITLEHWFAARLAICERAPDMTVIPSIRVSPDTYDGWSDPAEWRKDYEFARKVLDLTGSDTLYIDTEAYPIKSGKKYPYPDVTYDMFAAMGPWRELLPGLDIRQTPGGAGYLQSVTIGTLARKAYMHDQYTFDRMSDDGAELAEIIRTRKAWCEAHGFVYVPGFYARHLTNPRLYALLQACGVTEAWAFWQATEDDYSKFGTADWRWAR